MSINLVQWEGSTVTPKLDAIMYDDGSYGIIKGCAITHQGTNLLKIANGFIKIAGRLIEIAEETIQCQVSASGTVNGQLWLRLDLSSVTPAVFMTEAAAVLTPLTQNADCNFQNGIYELQLATYNIDESVITNLVETAPELERLRTALDNIDLAANKVTYDNTHSGLSATKVQGAIDEINDNLTELNNSYKVENGEPLWSADGGVTWENFSIGAVLLWTNSAPTASFTAQILNLDLSNYEYLVVICKYSTNQDILPRTSTLVKIDDQETDYTGLSATNTVGSNVSRGVKASSNSVTFTACTGGSGTYNSSIIPIYILGLKKCPISNLESYTE